jgi:hypothetical protein
MGQFGEPAAMIMDRLRERGGRRWCGKYRKYRPWSFSIGYLDKKAAPREPMTKD